MNRKENEQHKREHMYFNDRIVCLADEQFRQKEINELVSDKFAKGSEAFNRIADELLFLRKLAVGLVFISAGLTVSLFKTKTQIQEIRKLMNEG